MKSKNSHISKFAIGLIIICNLIIIFSNAYWHKSNKVLTWDVMEYYSYLPATFIHHDLSTESIPLDQMQYYWVHPTPSGGNVFKFTMGLSILYSPFFLLSHAYASWFGNDTLGFSAPYKFGIIMSSLSFLILGLIFLRKILKRYFKDLTVALVLVFIVLGTNLLFYASIRAAMSHVYNFSLFAIFIYLTVLWYEKPNIKFSILLGIVMGFISLIRPSNAIIVMFFLLYGIDNFKSIYSRISMLYKNYYLIIVIGIFTLLIWVPQMLYWKSMTGQFFYYTYSDEGFFFNHPQIIKTLFGYRNGLFLYTPMMVFSIIGLYFLYKKQKAFFYPLIIFTALNIYIISSWWCWWYVGFGNRAYIDSFALLAIPFASFIEVVLARKVFLKISFFTIAVFFLVLNVFQSYQFLNGGIQPDSMTKKAYWYLFLNMNHNDKHWGMLEKPDYDLAKKGIYKPITNEK